MTDDERNLFRAIDLYSRNTEEAARLIDALDWKQIDIAHRQSALCHAAEIGCAPILSFLLTNRAQLGITVDGQYPITFSGPGITNTENNTNTITTWSDPALSVAAQHGQVECAKLLLQHGANVNFQGGPSRYTPLLNAAGQPNANMVMLLLQHRANPNQANQHHAPLFLATQNFLPNAVLLLLAGAQPDSLVTQRLQALYQRPSDAPPQFSDRLFSQPINPQKLTLHFVWGSSQNIGMITQLQETSIQKQLALA
ncbi:MAG: hypothetical protein A3E83_01140 [Gammaproteobacteria bacterium RIFCSPHIGHO2_12_FULL_41_20]|nr:MAG: hypothetical protein A3E83_01140 [Gammaproteobacteria bacterium RIFCSPHIGHO2_12_FULL_41_20]